MTKKTTKGTQTQAQKAEQKEIEELKAQIEEQKAVQPSIEELMQQLEAQKAELAKLQVQNKELAAKAAKKGGKQSFPPVLWAMARGVVGTFLKKVPKEPTFTLESLEAGFSSLHLKQAVEVYLLKSTLANPFKTSETIKIDGQCQDADMTIEKAEKAKGTKELADLLIKKFQSVIKLIEIEDNKDTDNG